MCAAELYKGIDEADEVLRFNIVQGQLNDKGNYGQCADCAELIGVYILYCTVCGCDSQCSVI